MRANETVNSVKFLFFYFWRHFWFFTKFKKSQIKFSDSIQASKKLANETKVNCIPGYSGVVENAEHCVTLSNQVRYACYC
jgi:hypothetical protein